MDRTLKLGVANAADITQDMITTYFGTLGTDNIVIRERDNAAWVIGKLKIHFFKYPHWCDEVKLDTYLTSQRSIAVDAEVAATNTSGELLFVGVQQLCPIDMETRKIRKIETITYPSDEPTLETKMPQKFGRLTTDFAPEDKAFETRVCWPDTDFSYHTNNVNYIRYAMNTIPLKVFDTKEIEDLEVHFLSESKEGDVLTVYRQTIDNCFDFVIKKGDVEVVRARMTLRNK